MSTEVKHQHKLASVKQFNCKNCGNALSVLHPRAQYIACPYCGTELEANTEEHKILSALSTPKSHPPLSFIQLGHKAQLDDINYQVISRTRWKMDYQEYWSDEDGSGYSTEVWVYDEWLLLSEYYTYLYLIEDREGYAISEEITPELPILRPKNLKMRLFKDQRQRRILEYGKASVIFFEGESNYQIKKGDETQFSMFRDHGIDFLAEWRIDPSTSAIKEIEFFREKPISKARLLDAFAMNPSVLEVKKHYEHWGFVKNLAFVAAIGMGLLILMAYGAGKEIFQQTISVSETLDKEVLSLPVEVSEAGLYRLKLGASSLANETEIYVFAYILDDGEKPINVVDTDFYYYTGVDSEGRWTESDMESSQAFQIHQPGTYYIQLYTNQERVSPSGTISVALVKGIWLKRYFAVGLIGFICLWIFAYARRNF